MDQKYHNRSVLIVSIALVLVVALVLILVLVSTNRTVNGKRSYLYPLIPFNGKALGRLLLRRRKDS